MGLPGKTHQASNVKVFAFDYFPRAKDPSERVVQHFEVSRDPVCTEFKRKVLQLGGPSGGGPRLEGPPQVRLFAGAKIEPNLPEDRKTAAVAVGRQRRRRQRRKRRAKRPRKKPSAPLFSWSDPIPTTHSWGSQRRFFA